MNPRDNTPTKTCLQIHFNTKIKKLEGSHPDYRRASQALESLLQRQDLGFFRIPERSPNWSLSQDLGVQLQKRFDALVVVGIGGSSLGPKVLIDLFEGTFNSKRVFLCENVDVEDYLQLWKKIYQTSGLEKTAWVFVSKSGSTIETLTSANFIVQHYEENKVPFYDKAFLISEDRPNPLTDWGKKHNLPLLEIPIDVGGRFSVLTPVGLLPAAFMGVPLEEIRKGAALALGDRETLSQIIAQSLASFQREEWITLFWFYSSRLRNLGAWIQQLWAESLGKKMGRKTGQEAPRASTPLAAIGACDQHSILQQVLEGAHDKFVIFLRAKSAESPSLKLKASQFPHLNFFIGKSMGDLLAAEAQATAESLSQAGVSNLTLVHEDLSPQTLGYQFLLWELVVGGLGEAMDINAFDQPAVEVGKKIAREILAQGV